MFRGLGGQLFRGLGEQIFRRLGARYVGDWGHGLGAQIFRGWWVVGQVNRLFA